MATSVSVRQRVRRLSFGPALYMLFVLCALLLFPLHEAAHYLTYRLLGIHVQMTLNAASPGYPSQRKALAELAGPLLNLVVASVAVLFYHSYRRQFWAALALASAMMRLVIYVLLAGAALITSSGVSLGNDEPTAARVLGLPSLTLVAVLAVPFVLIVWSVVQTFQGRPDAKLLHVLSLGLTMFCVGMFVANILNPWLFPILDPWLFRNR